MWGGGGGGAPRTTVGSDVGDTRVATAQKDTREERRGGGCGGEGRVKGEHAS